MKSILVTGATGFIARHLIPSLIEHGLRVKAASRDLSIRLPHDLSPVNVGYINGSTDWRQALIGIDSVIHLAARAHILREQSSKAEEDCFSVNVPGTANLVNQSIEAGVKHFIFVSSIGAMATLSDRPLDENSPCHPETHYGKSKLQAEKALIDLADGSDMTWTILRPTLVYGPGNPGNMARLTHLIKLGLPLPLGSLRNRRNFLYVGNLVDAIVTCLTHPKARNQTFIVSDGEELSTPGLIHKLAYHSGYPCCLFPLHPSILRTLGCGGDWLENLTGKSLALNSDIISRLTGSLSVNSHKIRQMLSWHPPYTLDEGLTRTFES